MDKNEELRKLVKEYWEKELNKTRELVEKLQSKKIVTAKDLIKVDSHPIMFLLGRPAVNQLAHASRESPLIIDMGFLSKYEDFRFTYGGLDINKIFDYYEKGLVFLAVAETDFIEIKDEKLLDDYIKLFELCIDKEIPSMMRLNHLLYLATNRSKEWIEEKFRESINFLDKNREKIYEKFKVYLKDKKDFDEWFIEEMIFVTAFDTVRIYSFCPKLYDKIRESMDNNRLFDANYMAHLGCKYNVNKYVNSLGGYSTFTPGEVKGIEKYRLYLPLEKPSELLKSIGEFAKYATNPINLAAAKEDADISHVLDIGKGNEKVIKLRNKAMTYIKNLKDTDKKERYIKEIREQIRTYETKAKDLNVEEKEDIRIEVEQVLYLGPDLMNLGRKGIVEVTIGRKISPANFGEPKNHPDRNSLGLIETALESIGGIKTVEIDPVIRQRAAMERTIWEYWSDKAWVAYLCRH